MNKGRIIIPPQSLTLMWKQWVSALAGLLVIAFAYSGYHIYRFVIAGAIIAVLCVWSAMEKK